MGSMVQVLGMVFDTTASNSGEHSGACRYTPYKICYTTLFDCSYIEVWLETAILWLACRRHIAELHLDTAVKCVMGRTKDPGVALFRRLRSQWKDLNIDYREVVGFVFKLPGPDHHERWMSKCLYFLKINLLC